MNTLENQIITVSKARRILGSYADQLDDDQVREMVHTLHLLAREQLCYSGSKKVPNYDSKSIDES